MLTPASRSGSPARKSRRTLDTYVPEKQTTIAMDAPGGVHAKPLPLLALRAIFISSPTPIAEATRQTCNLDTDRLNNPRFRRSWEKKSLLV
jgi:hypothetical protein